MVILSVIFPAMLLLSKNLPSLKNSLRSKTSLFSTIHDFKYENFDFEITANHSKSKARLSTITTPHGKVECPNFVFCGTKAAMKAVTIDQLKAEGSQIMLSNTYHLLLTPGPDIVGILPDNILKYKITLICFININEFAEKMGGLQKFTNWQGPMLTDSGGYQIFSMGYGSVSNEIKGEAITY